MTKRAGRTKHHKKAFSRKLLTAYAVLAVLAVCSISLLVYGLSPEEGNAESKETAAGGTLTDEQESAKTETPSGDAAGSREDDGEAADADEALCDGKTANDGKTADAAETATPEKSADGEKAAAGKTVPTAEETAVSLPEDAEAAGDSEPASESDPAGATESGIASMPELLQLPAGSVVDAGQVDFSNPAQYFAAAAIEKGDFVYQRINGRSWQENPYLSLSDLRYLKMLHYNFQGQIQVGEMIVNKSIAGDVCNAFAELFACGYQIQSMYLIDNYWTGDPEDSDTASVEANNSSAFCYRSATDGAKLSMHAYGKAVDINPQQNPYVYYQNGTPRWYHANADAYIDRNAGLPHMIDHEDAAFLIFSKYGFGWGGDWKNQKDYQHFQKK